MSLRESPKMTPALLAALRSNARKSTGPRTAAGKAWSRLNALKNGGYSPRADMFYGLLLDDPTNGLLARQVLTPEEAGPTTQNCSTTFRGGWCARSPGGRS